MTADHCTLFPEGDWGNTCCKKHDKGYERVGLSKYQADKLLYRCVKKKGHPVVAAVMFAGVSLFGWLNYYKAQKRIEI